MRVPILSLIFVQILALPSLKNSSKKIGIERTVPYNFVKVFYDWFFLDVRILFVVNLMEENKNIRPHLDNFFISIGVNRRNIRIHQAFVKEKENEKKNELYSEVNFESEEFNIEESDEKLRTYADFNRGFVLVSTSPVLTLDYLKDRERSRWFYHRDISIFLITDTVCENPNFEGQIFQLLKTAWKNHGLLNVIVQTVCNFTHRFYVYRPLNFRNGTYGTLDRYNLEDILRNPRVTLNSLRTLNDISLKVNIFYRYPTALEVTKSLPNHLSTCHDVLEYSHNVGGVDGCTLAHLAKHLNFTAAIEDTKGQGINRFGHILPNGTLTGSLGDIIERRTDIAMNGVFLDYKYAFFNVEFSQVTQSHRICPVVPKSGKIPAWASILRVFSVSSWIFISILALTMCIFIDLLSSKSSSGIYYVFFKTVSINSTRTFRYRVVLAVYLFVFHVILAGIFNGHLFRNFSTVSYYPDINSLQELADSDLPIETTLNVLNDDEKESELMRRLAGKVVKNYDGAGPAIERAAFYKNIVALEQEGEALLKIDTKYLDRDGSPLLHVLDDCIMTQFISKIVPEGSPFLLVFNVWFSRFLESGLTFKWTTSPFLPPKSQGVVSARLALDKLGLVFGVLLIGLMISSVGLIGELIFHKIQVTMDARLRQNTVSTNLY